MTSILFEHGTYFMIRTAMGYEVYQHRGTHSVRVGSYGNDYYERAKSDMLNDKWARWARP